MIVNTKGLVIRTINYGETSVIATIYTKELGLRTYMLKGVRASRGKKKGNIYQPMNFLDMVVSERENKTMQYVRESKTDFLFRQVPYDIRKTAIGLFMLEVISTAVKEMEANEDLYSFLENQYQQLDGAQESFADFHLRFMLRLSQLLGFYPFDNYNDQNNLFALQDGQFVSLDDQYPNCLTIEDSLLFHQFLSEQEKQFSKTRRRQLLELLERYYQFHVAEFKKFKTPTVFEDVFG